MKNKIAIIAGVQVPNRGIGFDGDLLYKIPADMKRFKELTEGHVVIMGRKTWESLPEKFRPLPNRHNIVLTRDAAYDAPGATVCSSLEDALESLRNNPLDIFLIGGATIYQEGMQYADTLYLTEFYGSKEADTFFSDYSDFGEEVSREEFGCLPSRACSEAESESGKEGGVRFDFVTIKKKA